jgi:hypothetical protein
MTLEYVSVNNATTKTQNHEKDQLGCYGFL